MTSNTSNKTALVTGASSGIGKDFAELLAEQGYNLVLVARRENRLQQLKQQLESVYKVQVQIEVADLADLAACEQLVTNLSSTPDILINNAGVGYQGKFVKQDWVKQHQMMRLNMDSLTYLTRTVGEQMAQQGKGRILQVASIGAFTPCPEMAIYDATKAYVLTLGEALNHELKKHKVTVTSLCPGGTRTEFFDQAGLKLNPIVNATLMTSRTCAEIGLKGMFKGKSIVVPGLLNKITVWFLRHSPRQLLAPIAARVM